MAVGNITSQNATLVMTVDELFPGGITLEMFGTDAAFSQDQEQVTETRKSVDGKMVAGKISPIKIVTVTLESASPSFDAMMQLYRAMEKGRTIYEVTMTARIPSIGQSVTWTSGVLHDATPVPPVNQVLDPTTWIFHFGDLNVEDIT